MTQVKKTGVIASLKFISKSKGDWKKYALVFEDGESFEGIVQPDQPKEIAVGDAISFYEGRSGAWTLDKNYNGAATPSRGSSAGNSNAYISPRDKYWEDKDKYEREEKDPRLEWQGIFTNISSIYAAAIPTLAKPPTDTKQLDDYIDDLYSKVDAVLARRRKLREKK
jgi:hypothetical protein